MFKTIKSAKALSVARESVEWRGECEQREKHLRHTRGLFSTNSILLHVFRH
jgi:hypothetical protein